MPFGQFEMKFLSWFGPRFEVQFTVFMAVLPIQILEIQRSSIFCNPLFSTELIKKNQFYQFEKTLCPVSECRLTMKDLLEIQS